jgi:glycosyltransferase involved in cell wall biosynthesis
MENKRKLFIGITAPLSVVLIKGQLKYFVKKGFIVYLLAPDTNVTREFCKTEGSVLLPVPIEREISPLKDFRALRIIFNHIKTHRPDVVNVGTPKMGLLGAIAARFLKVPNRIYTCRGFRYEHESGFKKWLLVRFDKLINTSVHRIICISKSVKDKGEQDGVFDKSKTVLIGKGSSNGVDLIQFDPDNQNGKVVNELKIKYKLNQKFVFGFLGRIVDRKGVNELYDAFIEINKEFPNTKLVVVGKANLEQVRDKNLVKKMEDHPDIELTGFVTTVSEHFKLFDVFVLPAWWEGFGNALIQAASMRLPIISCNVTGCKDAVNDGYNGVLIPSKNTQLLKESMINFLQDEELRKSYGHNGVKWAKHFSSEFIWDSMDDLYIGNA